MRADKHFRLRTLGQLALEAQVRDVVTPTAVRPRHLALLAVLAVSPRALRRDALAELFWGGEPDTRARHSLSNALSALRAELGGNGISARRDDVRLHPDLRLAVDALEFTASAESRDDARAAALYRGPFLDGVVVPDAPGFDAWVARERSRHERAFLAVCERHAPRLLRAGAWDECAELAERWLYAAPSSPLAFTTLLRARSGSDTPAARRAALDDYARLRDWLEEEHGIRPDPAVGTLAAELEARVVGDERATALDLAVRPPAGAGAAPPPAGPGPVSSPSTRRWWRAALGVAGLAGLALLGVALVQHRPIAAAATAGTPVVAITDITNVRGDTALDWLEDGLPQIITESLSGEGGVETVPQVRVRDVLLRRGGALHRRLTEADAADVARRVGANWAVRGGITGGGGVYILDLDVRDVHSGKSLQSFTVMAANPVQLGRLAAARILEIATAEPSGASELPRFADVSTTRPEAYRHYVLGLTAAAEHRGTDALHEFDAAIALDSGFVDALRERRGIAAYQGDPALVARLDSLIARHPDRVSNWDRQVDEIGRATESGAVERSEALAQRFVARYPRDPRAYDVRAGVLTTHGRWLAADSVYAQELALDSLAMEAGNGPCAPCGAYAGLVEVKLVRGDLEGAERAARRWVALQPGIPGSWVMLSMALQFAGKGKASVEAARRAAALTNETEPIADLARTLMEARRFDEADSLVTVLRRRPDGQEDAVDIAVTLARERGQFRRSAALLQPTEHTSGLELVEADNLMRLHRVAEAKRLYEEAGHRNAPSNVQALTAEQARDFTWAHALEGDALWRIGDTTATRVLMDSVRYVGARSYYGRDWNLYKHLAGLLALSRGDTSTAERDLSAARWGVSGWVTTVMQLGEIHLAQGDAAGAVALFRQAREGPLNAMGRYVPHTEMDFWLARAFARAGERDSARVYANWVRKAWDHADPEVKARLAQLPR